MASFKEKALSAQQEAVLTTLRNHHETLLATVNNHVNDGPNRRLLLRHLQQAEQWIAAAVKHDGVK